MPVQFCNVPGCYNFGKYCRREGHTKEIVKPYAKPQKEADNKKAVMNLYRKKARLFISKHPKCAVCSGKSECVHHKAGRIGDNLMNEKTWLPVCLSCHTIIEQNPDYAKQKGYSVSRLKPTS